MELNLQNPLIFFDLESTGLNVSKDRIVEISYIKVMPNGTDERRTILINPEMHIPEESTAIHGIKDEDVKDAPRFKDVAKELARVFQGCDIAGFNSNRFDIPMLMEEFLRAHVEIDLGKHRFVDVQTIFHKMEQRNLAAAYRFYCGKELEDAHSASADTLATYEVLKAQLDKYPSLENNIAFLSNFSSQNRNVDLAGRIVYNDQNVEVFNFGIYKGVPVAEVLQKDSGYFGWLMNGDFPQNTKNVLTNIKLKMRNA